MFKTSIGLLTAVLALALSSGAKAEQPDAAKIFVERCAVCHDHPTGRTPARAYLLPRLPSEIVHALSRGVMRTQAAGLTEAQMGALAVYLTGRPLDREPDARANSCAVPGTAPWAPATRFEALVPGRYTVCAVASVTAVTCRPALVAPSPPGQSVDLR